MQTVCECILIIKGYKELNWKTAKGMMSDPNFLRSLMELDFDSITQGQVKNIKGEWERAATSLKSWRWSSWAAAIDDAGLEVAAVSRAALALPGREIGIDGNLTLPLPSVWLSTFPLCLLSMSCLCTNLRTGQRKGSASCT